MAIKVGPLFAVGGGVILLWSGFTNRKWSTVLKNVIRGEDPRKAAQNANPIIGTPLSALSGAGYGIGIGKGASQIPTGHGVYSEAAIRALWVSAGGNPAKADVALCICNAESGRNPNAKNPTPCAIGSNAEGLWQICMPLNQHYVPGGNAFIPMANARAAVVMSQNGTNWGPWSTAGSCGV